MKKPLAWASDEMRNLGMRRETSLYLDLIRILAALAVLLTHAKRERITYGFLAPFGQFGDEAVIIFFIISGIVISYVFSSRENSATSYAVARLSRLWSVVVPATILTIILDILGSRIDPSVYEVFQLPLWRPDASSVWQAFAPIVFINQTWLEPTSPGSNGPFWSIGYEAWYYIGFGLFIFLRGWARVLSLFTAALMVGPSILCLSSFWILGALIFHHLGRGGSSKTVWSLWALTLLSTTAFLALKYKIMKMVSLMLFGTLTYPPLFGYGFPTICIGALFGVNVLCFDRIGHHFRHLGNRAEVAIRFLASRTFSLYLYQAPLLFFFGACTSHIHVMSARIAIVYIGTLTSVFFLSEVSERRKHVVAGWLWALGRR